MVDAIDHSMDAALAASCIGNGDLMFELDDGLLSWESEELTLMEDGSSNETPWACTASTQHVLPAEDFFDMDLLSGSADCLPACKSPSSALTAHNTRAASASPIGSPAISLNLDAWLSSDDVINSPWPEATSTGSGSTGLHGEEEDSQARLLPLGEGKTVVRAGSGTRPECSGASGSGTSGQESHFGADSAHAGDRGTLAASASVPLPAPALAHAALGMPAHAFAGFGDIAPIVRMMPVWVMPTPECPQGRVQMMPVHFLPPGAQMPMATGARMEGAARNTTFSGNLNSPLPPADRAQESEPKTSTGVRKRRRTRLSQRAAEASAAAQAVPAKRSAVAMGRSAGVPSVAARSSSQMVPPGAAAALGMPLCHGMLYMPRTMPLRRTPSHNGSGGTLPPFASQLPPPSA